MLLGKYWSMLYYCLKKLEGNDKIPDDLGVSCLCAMGLWPRTAGLGALSHRSQSQSQPNVQTPSTARKCKLQKDVGAW